MEPEPHKLPLRFYEIDLLRFLAALSVVFYHYTYVGWVANDFSPVKYVELGAVTRYGFLGVQLFFIISGYVVLMSAHGKTVRQFLVFRVKRLYPAFWVACLLTFAVVRAWGPAPGTLGWSSPLDVSLKELGINLTMLHSFVGIKGIDPAYWSLGIEISFYFLIALVIGWNLYRALPWVLVIWLAYCTYAGPDPAGSTHFSLLFFPSHAPYFIAGMVFYMLQNKWFSAWKLYSLLGASFLLALRSMQAAIAGTILVYHEPNFSFPVAAAVITLFYGVFFLIIRRVLNLSRHTWLSQLGALTYPLYLLHASIGYVIFQHVGNRLNKYVLLAGLLVLMLGLAYAVQGGERRYSKWVGVQANKLFAFLSGGEIRRPLSISTQNKELT